MIRGVKHWDSKDHYYVQTNNPTEEVLRKRKNGNWLVSCGPTAAVSCLAAMGCDVAIRCPGEYKPQSEEVLMDYFNDPRNYETLRKIRPETPPDTYHGNEVPQFYAAAVAPCAGAGIETDRRAYRNRSDVEALRPKPYRDCAACIRQADCPCG